MKRRRGAVRRSHSHPRGVVVDLARPSLTCVGLKCALPTSADSIRGIPADSLGIHQGSDSGGRREGMPKPPARSVPLTAGAENAHSAATPASQCRADSRIPEAVVSRCRALSLDTSHWTSA